MQEISDSTANQKISDNKQNNTNPFVSIVMPAFNEAAIVKENLHKICKYMESIEDEYSWELIFINDGSTDRTGEIADEFAETRVNVFVLHHQVNFRLGQALRFAFNNCNGDYIVTLDVDLSYSPDHIKRLLDKIDSSTAKIVIASPYMKGGKISNVPWLRKVMSYWANRFMSISSTENIRTFTGMVRAYDRRFLSTLNLKAMDNEINPEIIYKAQLLRARIEEIPAHLDWGSQNQVKDERVSSIRISRGILSGLFSGFIFRPFMFFVLPGFLLVLVSLYPILWAIVHTLNYLRQQPYTGESIDFNFSDAVASAFQLSPHSFIVGGVLLIVGLQLISLGIISLQNKRYFEELFHLGTTIYKSTRDMKKQE
jgi:glycosyltransferase involved in cell wall biosynthesis